MQYYVVNNELYHYGVKGMKWGVRKSVYKSMTGDQRKRTRSRYRKTSLGKTTTAVGVGTFLAGPLAGVAAGMITAKVAKLPLGKTKERGEAFVKKYANVRIETDITKVERIMRERKVPYDDRVYDRNGNLIAIFQGDD